MSPENTEKLYKAFPDLYRLGIEKKDMMKYGFSCHDGWFELIWRLSESIMAECVKLGIEPGKPGFPQAVQVKEKFGTLRYYVREIPIPDQEKDFMAGGMVMENHGQLMSWRPVSSIDSIGKLIRQAEDESAHICEKCGAPGVLRKTT